MMNLAPTRLFDWFRQHDIDPDKVTVILRCNDPGTKSKVHMALDRDAAALAPDMTRVPGSSSAPVSLQINGIKFVLRGPPSNSPNTEVRVKSTGVLLGVCDDLRWGKMERQRQFFRKRALAPVTASQSKSGDTVRIDAFWAHRETMHYGPDNIWDMVVIDKAADAEHLPGFRGFA